VKPHLLQAYLVANDLQESHLTIVSLPQLGHLNSLNLNMASLPQLEHLLTMDYNYALPL
jgi:hypothetical protein